MANEFAVSVQVYSLGHYGLRKHSALEITQYPVGKFSVCFEALVVRTFQCNLCSDSEWRLQHNMKTHFQERHSDQHWKLDSERFVRGVFKTQKQFVMNQFFVGQSSACSGAKLQTTEPLAVIAIPVDKLESVIRQWDRQLQKSKYDESANNCNHQIEKLCSDLRHLGIRRPGRFTNWPARLALALLGPLRG